MKIPSTGIRSVHVYWLLQTSSVQVIPVRRDNVLQKVHVQNCNAETKVVKIVFCIIKLYDFTILTNEIVLTQIENLTYALRPYIAISLIALETTIKCIY